MTLPMSCDLQLIHLKSTESLGRALDDGAKSNNCQIQLISTENITKLRLVTGKGEYCFQLEQDKSSGPTYFCIAHVDGSNGTLLGPVLRRLRTAADDESFKHAREGLVKEVEEHRQQKLMTRIYQEESASTLKVERCKTAKRALKLETKRKRSKPSTDTRSISTVLQNARSNAKVIETRTLLPEATMPVVSTDQSASRTDERIRTPVLPHKTAKVIEAQTLKPVGKTLSSVSLRDRCLWAISRRRVLEARLATALANADKVERGTSVEEIRSDLFAFVDELLGDTELKQLKAPVTKLH